MMMWLYDEHEYSLFTESLMRKYIENMRQKTIYTTSAIIHALKGLNRNWQYFKYFKNERQRNILIIRKGRQTIFFSDVF